MGKQLLSAAMAVGIVLGSSTALAKDPSVKKLKKAPTRVAVGAAVLRLEAHLFFDTASAAKSSTAPLAGALKLRTSESQPLPPGLSVDRVWLIQRRAIWSPAEPTAKTEAPGPGQPRTTINIRFTGGPNWKTGSKVTCVVQIAMVDGSEGLLRADKTAISATP